MFSLDKLPFGPFEQYRILSPDGRTAMHLVPGAGANLTQLVLNGRSVLDGYTTAEALQEAKGGKSAVLFPFPNRLDGGRYAFFGQEYAFPINHPATGNAIHGFVRHEPFTVDRVVLAGHFAAVTCSYHYSGKHAFFPFPFQIDLEFAVYTRGVFRLMVVVRNLNHFDMPMGFGWHPYFKVAGNTDAHLLTLPSFERIEVDERLLPTGERTPLTAFSQATALQQTRFDHCFAYAGNEQAYSVHLEGPSGRLCLQLTAAEFPFFQLFTPEDRNSIALEPMSCNINALQNGEGLVQLPPDGVWQGAIEVSLT